MPTLDDVLAQLATAPPSEFTRERNALVTRLTKLGQKEAAARVKAVPRPTVSVWVVNRLAREAPKNVERLITTAAQMRAAQLGGGDLRAARAGYQAALAHLSERAAAILREPGLGASQQVLLRVETTLTAAAAARELRPALRQGRLERDLAARGFEVFPGEKLPPAPRDRAKAPAVKAPAVRAAATEEPPAENSTKVAPAERQAARLSKAREDLARVEAEAARRHERLTAASQRVAELRQTLQGRCVWRQKRGRTKERQRRCSRRLRTRCVRPSARAQRASGSGAAHDAEKGRAPVGASIVDDHQKARNLRPAGGELVAESDELR
jgi:hypothetical protein